MGSGQVGRQRGHRPEQRCLVLDRPQIRDGADNECIVRHAEAGAEPRALARLFRGEYRGVRKVGDHHDPVGGDPLLVPE